MPRLPMQLLGGNSNPGLWQKVADHLKVKLCDTEITQFANGGTYTAAITTRNLS